MIDVVEATIAELRDALESGAATSVGLVNAYLARIAAYDGPSTNTALNAVVVRNPDVLVEAEASDARRARGELLGPLDGIPYTAKDSYLVRGLTAASGSPAFADLVAQRDAFTIERLRDGGAICLGLTNMPPMANGGMQRGVYGRAESPYNADFLSAPFASGSSNGSGTATAASFAAFGMGEETWSSGRGPARSPRPYRMPRSSRPSPCPSRWRTRMRRARSGSQRCKGSRPARRHPAACRRWPSEACW